MRSHTTNVYRPHVTYNGYYYHYARYGKPGLPKPRAYYPARHFSPCRASGRYFRASFNRCG